MFGSLSEGAQFEGLAAIFQPFRTKENRTVHFALVERFREFMQTLNK
ncbi:hypothetical protein [Brucella sp. 10RB9213]|nr:hypothetical protein [Brucella sp. 10RB9213]MRN67818.1 hypothetical protein [Brucella sp. 10RB9213]